MAIRLRARWLFGRVEGVGLVALCAARSVEKLGDVYLDDTAHMALARKTWQDYPELGIAADPGVVAATKAEESNNLARDEWDRTFGSDHLRAPLAAPEPSEENVAAVMMNDWMTTQNAPTKGRIGHHRRLFRCYVRAVNAARDRAKGSE